MKYQKYILLTLSILFYSWSNVHSQTHLFSYETYTNDAGESLKYRQLTSDYDSKSTYPLVIFLHGSGERGSDNEAQLKWGALNFASDYLMKNHQPIVIAPQCPEGMNWGNFNYDKMAMKKEMTQPMKLLFELIEQAKSTLPVDPDRIYITGLSMGGFGTFDAIARQPDLFAAAVPVCGGGDTSKVKDFAHIPMWIFHGALDDVVPPKLSHDMVEALMKAGAKPGYTQYPEAGHFSWVPAYSDKMMMDWLFSQKR